MASEGSDEVEAGGWEDPATACWLWGRKGKNALRLEGICSQTLRFLSQGNVYLVVSLGLEKDRLLCL